MLVWNSVCLQQPQPRKSEAALADTRLKVKHGHCATIPLSLSLGSSLKTASHVRVQCTGGEPQSNATIAEAVRSYAGCGPARGRQIWRFRPRGQCCFSRPSEVVGLYHCTALGLLVYWLTACLFRCRKAKKVRTLSCKTPKNL